MRTLVLIAAVVVIACAAHAGTVVYTDNDWQGWSSSVIGSYGASWQRQTTGGNPGAYAACTMNPYWSVQMRMINSTAVYDPRTQGGVSSVNLSIDFRTGITTYLGMGVGVVAYQNGHYYGAPLYDGSGISSTWRHLRYGTYVVGDFGLIDTVYGDTKIHPDFSTSGAPITWGLLVNDGETSPHTNPPHYVDFDNWRVTLTTVPEPAAWTGLAFGIGLMLSRRRGRSC